MKIWPKLDWIVFVCVLFPCIDYHRVSVRLTDAFSFPFFSECLFFTADSDVSRHLQFSFCDPFQETFIVLLLNLAF
ncbi:hypothetical protein VTN00DRAFT_5722 [Thermoascus crustaceus]|uniref:uncharacterized protein n=1 Tax=Thermoascus crustaceus TaxID=5088 RepID=UPI0037445C84